jgi:Flp pilus assembly protein protease CpaA
MNRESFLLLAALFLAVAAAIIDVQQHRIPNRLTYPGIALGLAVRSVLFGWKGLATGAAGCLLAGGIMLFFYAVKAMGAGDVKLMCCWRLPSSGDCWPLHTPFIVGELALPSGMSALC